MCVGLLHTSAVTVCTGVTHTTYLRSLVHVIECRCVCVGLPLYNYHLSPCVKLQSLWTLLAVRQIFSCGCSLETEVTRDSVAFVALVL